MPQPRLEVTEHQAQIYTCACCRGVTRAAAICLNAQHLIPEDRVGEIMHDLFGAPLLCPASVVAWGEHKAQEWAVVEAEIAARLATAAVRHLDETGFRISASASGPRSTRS
jgi:transposase